MPSLTHESGAVGSDIIGGHPDSRPRLTQPLTYSGSLDSFEQSDLTPVIGREFEGLQIRDLLKWDDQTIRDLALTISQRGVVFLRNQDVTPIEMKDFMLKLTELAGCPESSGLHVHPLTEEGSELGDQISVISSAKQKKGGGLTHQLSDVSRFASTGWHSDITFEKVPSDYAMLKIHTLPASGGDTLWASGYEIYDRLSEPMKKFFEGLTATHDANFFHDEAARLGNPLRKGQRGSPLNHGDDLKTVHPLVRTNPVTGWKSVYVNKGFTKRINGVTKDESDVLLSYIFNLVTQNHDAQVRFRWRKNDCAIWDNRSTFHCATYDYAADRAGDRLAESEQLKLLSKGFIDSTTPPSGDFGSFEIRTPKLYHYDALNNNQFTEYMPTGIDLKTYARRHLGSPTPNSHQPHCHELGQAIGSWLRGYHDWSARSQELNDLLAPIDEASKQVVKMVHFAWIPDRIEQYPEELAGMARDLMSILGMVEREWETQDDFQPVHGDFGPGNTLLPDKPLEEKATIPVFIIDWEVAQRGLRAVDIGEMLGDLYALWRYQKIDGGLWILQGFAEGYREESEAAVFRTAMQMGGRLLCHSLDLPEWGGEEQKREVAKLGAEVMTRAYNKDRLWFDEGELACLFTSVKG
ncbi:taurine catabolism dioxygenase tauD, tfdA family protein [Sarocladium implicatum]|nr:taurine catabolism dioxygenase tauD, tfdA family protein [Sarocladium implicatum]